MTPMFEAMLAKYGWVLIGVTVGFAAKYALLIKKGVKVRAWLVFADLLLLPLVALIAFWLATRVGWDAEACALLSAFCAVSADRLVKLLTDRFLARVDSEVRAIADETIGKVKQAVANEQAGQRIIDDTLEGRAPVEYVALRPHPRAGKPEGPLSK
jgi:hypothetical protein